MNIKRIVSIFIIYGITSLNIFSIEPLKLSQYTTKVLAKTILREYIENGNDQKYITLDTTLQILPEDHTIKLIDEIVYQYKFPNQYTKFITLLDAINSRIEPRNFLNAKEYLLAMRQRAIKNLAETILSEYIENGDDKKYISLNDALQILSEQHTIKLIDEIVFQYLNVYMSIAQEQDNEQDPRLINILNAINSRIEPRNFLNAKEYLSTIV